MRDPSSRSPADHVPPAGRARVSNGSADDPAAFPTAIVGIVGITLLVATVLLVYVVYERETAEERLRKSDVPAKNLEAYRAEQAARLGSYDWVDREQKIVTIPIERAMEIVATELGVATPMENGEEQ